MKEILKKAFLEGAIPDGWTEIESPDFFSFKTINDVITGRLLERNSQKAGANMAIKYTILTDDGKKVSFLGSADLDPKLKNIAPGRYIAIGYLADQQAGEGKNAMRIYRVAFGEKPFSGEKI